MNRLVPHRAAMLLGALHFMRSIYMYLYRFFGDFIPKEPLLGVLFIYSGLSLGEAALVSLTLSVTDFVFTLVL